jgi:pyruvate dehydrogenase E2 component (dihydrolipoyllysine-residue acetyltransferase)
MPALGADMDEGTLIEWLVKPGDEIRKGDIIAVVDTAKSAIEVESFHTGTVERLLAEPGTTVPVGTVLAVIRTAAPAEPGQPPSCAPSPAPLSAPPDVLAAAPAAHAHAAVARVTPLIRREARELGVDLATVHGSGRNGAITRADVEAAAARGHVAERPVAATALARAVRRPVTPLARRVAAELGVDLSAVTGSGAGGAVREADVRQAAAAAHQAGPPPEPPASPAPGGGQRARARAAREAVPTMPAAAGAQRAQAMRQAIAKLMARSKREIPHYYVSNTVDMGTALAWLRERNTEREVPDRLVPAALLLKAAALAARRVPQLNGFWAGGRFVPAPAVHLGVAISLRGGGLLTPAIHHADSMPAGELMRCLRDLVNRARAGRLRGSELADATITVTNLGDQGVESVTGVIYPPQVALVGFGKITERPWAVDGLLGVRPVVATTLSADHRATDGYAGARFLATVADLLQRPEEL